MATAGYLFNERPPAGLLVAQAVGITASTYLFGQTSTHTIALEHQLTRSIAGQNAAMSYAFIPAILLAPAPLAARQWKKVYDMGQRAGPPLAISSGLALAYVAYNRILISAPSSKLQANML